MNSIDAHLSAAPKLDAPKQQPGQDVTNKLHNEVFALMRAAHPINKAPQLEPDKQSNANGEQLDSSKSTAPKSDSLGGPLTAKMDPRGGFKISVQENHKVERAGTGHEHAKIAASKHSAHEHSNDATTQSKHVHAKDGAASPVKHEHNKEAAASQAKHEHHNKDAAADSRSREGADHNHNKRADHTKSNHRIDANEKAEKESQTNKSPEQNNQWNQMTKAIEHLPPELQLKLLNTFVATLGHGLIENLQKMGPGIDAHFNAGLQLTMNGIYRATEFMCELFSSNGDKAYALFLKDHEKDIDQLKKLTAEMSKPGSHFGEQQVKQVIALVQKIWHEPGEELAENAAGRVAGAAVNIATSSGGESLLGNLPEPLQGSAKAINGLNDKVNKIPDLKKGLNGLANDGFAKIHQREPLHHAETTGPGEHSQRGGATHTSAYEIASAGHSHYLLPELEIYDDSELKKIAS